MAEDDLMKEPDFSQSEMNRFGDAGWELVNVSASHREKDKPLKFWFFYKRPIKDEKAG